MIQYKISVILPVYNTGRFLKECVESILNQTLKEIEVIAIDDGSTDDSLEILNELAGKDERLQVYSQVNQGPSVTRNRGIDLVSGEYVYYMDSDDILDLDCLELCYNKAVKDELDLVLFNGTAFWDDEYAKTDLVLNYTHTGCPADRGWVSGVESLRYRLESNKFTPSSCLYICKASLIKESGVRFIDGIVHEDEHYAFLLHLQAKRVGEIDRFFFNRRMRQESIMTSDITWRNIDGYMTVCDELMRAKEVMSDEQKELLDFHLGRMLPQVVYKAYSFSLSDRMKLARLFSKKYGQYVPCMSFIQMMMKKPVDKLKGLMKK